MFLNKNNQKKAQDEKQILSDKETGTKDNEILTDKNTETKDNKILTDKDTETKDNTTTQVADQADAKKEAERIHQLRTIFIRKMEPWKLVSASRLTSCAHKLIHVTGTLQSIIQLLPEMWTPITRSLG